MNERKINYIDASKLTEKELCQVLGIKYIPWYRSGLFWGLALTFSVPSVTMILEVLLK